jgi:Rrf2 family protein
MKFSAQEEYGLRCLIRIAKMQYLKKGLTIPEISQSEGISQHNVAKILRLLRLGGFLESERGQSGGYTLARPAKEISINEVLYSLGGRLYDESFCESHSGIADICTNSIDCSVRSVWKMIQRAVDDVVSNLTLHDLLGDETSIFDKSFNNFSMQASQK